MSRCIPAKIAGPRTRAGFIAPAPDMCPAIIPVKTQRPIINVATGISQFLFPTTKLVDKQRMKETCISAISNAVICADVIASGSPTTPTKSP